MKNSEMGYVPEADYFERKLRSMQQFHDVQAPEVLVRLFPVLLATHVLSWGAVIQEPHL